MRNIFKLFLVLILAASACQDKPDSKAIAEEKNKKTLDARAAEKDAQFVVHTVSANYAVVEWTTPQLKVNQNRAVRDIAFKLQRDHMQLLDRWKDYAKKNNILTPDSSVAAVKQAVKKYAARSSDSLKAKTWVNEMLEQEGKILSKMEDYLDDAGDPALKLLMQEALPVIRVNRDQLMMLKSK